MFCKNCGEKINKEQAICLKCGVKTGVGDKHCSNCGKEVEENASVCLGCGFAIKKASTIPISSDIISKEHREFVLKNIVAILSGILVLSLFLPYCTIYSSEYGYDNDLTLTGIEALLGSTFTDGTYLSAGIFGWLMLLLPIALVVCNYVSKFSKFKKRMLLIAPIGALVSHILSEMVIGSSLAVSAVAELGYWIFLVVSIALILVCFLQYKNIPLNKEAITQYINKNK